jgi:hypothetical protein
MQLYGIISPAIYPGHKKGRRFRRPVWVKVGTLLFLGCAGF